MVAMRGSEERAVGARGNGYGASHVRRQIASSFCNLQHTIRHGGRRRSQDGTERGLPLEEASRDAFRATQGAFGAYIAVHDDVLLQMLLQAARGTLPLSAE